MGKPKLSRPVENLSVDDDFSIAAQMESPCHSTLHTLYTVTASENRRLRAAGTDVSGERMA